MDNKKFDLNSLIGFFLIGAVLLWMLYYNQDESTQVEEVGTPEKQESVEQTTPKNELTTNSPTTDSLSIAKAQEKLGAFGYSSTLPSAKENITTLENDVLELKISNKGGQIVEAKLKNFKTYDSLPIYIVKDGNASFNLNFTTQDNRSIATQDMYFEPSLSKDGSSLSMKLKVSQNEYLEYYYELKPENYMFDFAIRSNGLSNVINKDNIQLDWKLKAYRHAKSISYENKYTEILWEYEGDKDDYTGQGENDDAEDEDISWIAFKQHFFNSILLTDTPFERAKFVSKKFSSR